MVVSVGIDVSEDKALRLLHRQRRGEKSLADVFTVPNNMDGFHCLLQMLISGKNNKQKNKNKRKRQHYTLFKQKTKDKHCGKSKLLD